MSCLNFLGSSLATFKECHLLTQPTLFLRKCSPMALMVSFFKSPTFLGCTKVPPSAFSTPACEIDTHRLSHTLGEEVRGFHVRFAKEKHSHIHNDTLGGLGGTRKTRLLQALVCQCLRNVICGHGRITLSSFVTTRILSLGGGRGTISLGIDVGGDVDIVAGITKLEEQVAGNTKLE
jgi:hypothetical protein